MNDSSDRPTTADDLLHGLNNILNAISTQAELASLLIQQGKLEEAQRALETVVRDCKRCSEMQRDLLPG